MARRPKLTQEMVDEAIRLKADGLSNGDIICALGIHESTFYRWIGDPKNKLQRALSSQLMNCLRDLLTMAGDQSTGRSPAGPWVGRRATPSCEERIP